MKSESKEKQQLQDRNNLFSVGKKLLVGAVVVLFVGVCAYAGLLMLMQMI